MVFLKRWLGIFSKAQSSAGQTVGIKLTLARFLLNIIMIKYSELTVSVGT